MHLKNSKSYDYALFIGRFQPFHNGHLASVQSALLHAQNVLIVIGGYRLAPSPKDPWSAQERKTMILAALSNAERKRVRFVFIRDRLYNEDLWKENVIREVQLAINSHAKIAIFGHKKDESSYYLKIFPQWPFVETGNFFNINATDIRNDYFLNTNANSKASSHATQLDVFVPHAVARTLKKFKQGKLFKCLKEEYAFSQHRVFQKPAPIGLLQPQMRVLVVGSYVLLTKRHNVPGKNLYSLPLVSENILDDNYNQYIIKRQTFRHQKYDNYGKEIFFFKIPNSIAFDMKAYARSKQSWILLDDLYAIENKIFEDHYQMLRTVIAD